MLCVPPHRARGPSPAPSSYRATAEGSTMQVERTAGAGSREMCANRMIFEKSQIFVSPFFASSRMLLALMLVALATSAFATDKLSRAHCVVTKVRPAALSLSLSPRPAPHRHAVPPHISRPRAAHPTLCRPSPPRRAVTTLSRESPLRSPTLSSTSARSESAENETPFPPLGVRQAQCAAALPQHGRRTFRISSPAPASSFVSPPAAPRATSW